MKTIVAAFVALLATTNARPQEVQTLDSKHSIYGEKITDDIVQEIITKFVKELVADTIEEVKDLIKKNGLDPYVLVAEEYNLDGASGRIENLVISGHSNIVLNSVSYSGSAYDIDISLPRIAISVDDFISDVTFGSRNIQGEFSGSIAFVDLAVVATRSLDDSDSLYDWFLTIEFGGIEANFSKFIIQGQDVTDSVNNFFSKILPNLLNQD